MVFHAFWNVLERDCHIWRSLIALVSGYVLEHMVDHRHIVEGKVDVLGKLSIAKFPILLAFIVLTHFLLKLTKGLF